MHLATTTPKLIYLHFGPCQVKVWYTNQYNNRTAVVQVNQHQPYQNSHKSHNPATIIPAQPQVKWTSIPAKQKRPTRQNRPAKQHRPGHKPTSKTEQPKLQANQQNRTAKATSKPAKQNSPRSDQNRHARNQHMAQASIQHLLPGKSTTRAKVYLTTIPQWNPTNWTRVSMIYPIRDSSVCSEQKGKGNRHRRNNSRHQYGTAPNQHKASTRMARASITNHNRKF